MGGNDDRLVAVGIKKKYLYGIDVELFRLLLLIQERKRRESELSRVEVFDLVDPVPFDLMLPLLLIDKIDEEERRANCKLSRVIVDVPLEILTLILQYTWCFYFGLEAGRGIHVSCLNHNRPDCVPYFIKVWTNVNDMPKVSKIFKSSKQSLSFKTFECWSTIIKRPRPFDYKIEVGRAASHQKRYELKDEISGYSCLFHSVFFLGVLLALFSAILFTIPAAVGALAGAAACSFAVGAACKRHHDRMVQ